MKFNIFYLVMGLIALNMTSCTAEDAVSLEEQIIETSAYDPPSEDTGEEEELEPNY